MQKSKKTKKYFLGIGPWQILAMLLIGLGFLCFFAGRWYLETYGELGFDSILYTLTADMAGVESDLIKSFIKKVMVRVCFATFCVSLFLFIPSKNKIVMQLGKKLRFRLFPLGRKTALVAAFLVAAAFIGIAAVETEFTDFIYYMNNPSTFYEEEYRDPNAVQITFPEEKRNLIYIYLESMETTFLSEAEGGALKESVIPELHQLAKENLNFSPNTGVGGFFSPTGTTWTTAALVAQTAGVPLKVTAGTNHNEFGLEGDYMPGITTLTDILKENGYTQNLMFGSDAAFGGRYQYFTTHGIDRVYDYYTAIEDGLIPESYYVWWGFEDHYLYDYAQHALTELASQEGPFAFTMLTVDTHHVSGYVCSLCGNQHSEQYENVYSCASKQLYAFVKWLEQQPFYENTTVIIAGDHPSMDADYMNRRVGSSFDRRVYNCILNAPLTTEFDKNRQFAVVDMFPTTLAALGCTIEGERLGLGTNLFSGVPTLMETLGMERFDDEMARYSQYYVDNFFNP